MQLLNSLSQQIETFAARNDEVKLYVCGVTPYDTAHLGHAFVFTTFDILVRYLRSQGLRVVYVENVTDIDDPLFEKARELGNISWDQLAQQETERFVRAMQHTDTSDPSSALLSVQSVVVDPLDHLWILDTGAPQHRTTSNGGPKLVGVDLAHNRVITTILFPREVALATTYLNDLRFDLRRGEQGMAFLTDSSPQSNGLIVVDLASGQSWRRLHEHPSTKAEPGFLPIVEGQPLLLRPPDGPPQPYRGGVDGIAISHDGARLFYSALMGRHLF